MTGRRDDRASRVVLTTAVVLVSASCGGTEARQQATTPAQVEGGGSTQGGPAEPVAGADAGPVTTAQPESAAKSKATAPARDAAAPSPEPAPTRWLAVSAGFEHTCALSAQGAIWCWGANSNRQLGGATSESHSCTAVQVGMADDWVAVSAGDDRTMALNRGGELWGWGSNFHGALGLGGPTIGDFETPTKLPGAAAWAKLSAGGLSSCAIDRSGALACAGMTHQRSRRLTPIGGASPWAAVSVGLQHSCALAAQGSLWCWGFNIDGQLGNGQSDPQATATFRAPIQVGAATDWTAVSAGGFHTCGLRRDHSLWCWGSNIGGALGIGVSPKAKERATRPVRVGMPHWQLVSAGNRYSCGIRDDSTLWCWGMNAFGEVGDGSTRERHRPVQVGRGDDWTSVSAGNGHTCAIREDRSLWCWGVNNAAQLGLHAQAHCTLAGEREPCQREPARLDAARCPSKGGDGSPLGAILPPMPGD